MGLGWVVAVSLTMILARAWLWLGSQIASFVQSGDVALIDSGCLCFGVGGSCFSIESLILAQDERWRRA